MTHLGRQRGKAKGKGISHNNLSKNSILVAYGPRYIKRVYFQGKDGQVIYEFGYPNVPRLLKKKERLWVAFDNGIILNGENFIPKKLSANTLFNSCNGKWKVE